ncbi:MAG TPA: rod-binding protein [Desulfomicrobiaceae bacterium]|nr:rod-binding protein [Desulfomicrobiaceae bacterium]
MTTPITSSLAPVRVGTEKTNEPDKLRETCQEFEAIFVQTMLKGMRSTVSKDGFIESGQGEEMFEEFMDVEVAKSASRTAGFGIADALYRQMQKLK